MERLRVQLQDHQPREPREERSLQRTLAMLDWLPEPFDETADPTHVTASAIVLGADGRVLLHRHKRLGIWLQPGGHLDPGESCEQAALREVAEETGLEVAVDRFVGWTERLGHDDGRHFVILDFLALPADPEPHPSPADDAVEARFVDLADVAEYDLVEGLYDFLVEYNIIDSTRTLEW